MVIKYSAFMVGFPLAIANKYHDHQTNQPKSVRYRLILVRVSDLDWLRGDRLKDLQAHARAGHKWIPAQQLPYAEIILYAYAADRTNRPTYVCLPSGLYNARTGRVLAQAGPEQEITPLPGIYFFDGWRVHPTLVIPTNLPSTKEAPVCDVEAPAHSTASIEQPRSPEEEARDILATAAKNQTEDGPSTRRAAVRACTVEVPLSQPCFEHFFRPCFRGHDEAGLLAFEALRGSPRPARGQALDAKRNGTRTKRGSRGLESI